MPRIVSATAEAVLAHDVAVGKCGQETQVEGKRRPVRLRPARRHSCQQRFTKVENIRETGRVLTRDPVAISGGCHRLPQRHGCGREYVVAFGPTKTGRRRAHDGTKSEARVLDVEIGEHNIQCGAQVGRRRFGRNGERHAQENDTEVGVGADRRERRLDGGRECACRRACRAGRSAPPRPRRCAQTPPPSCDDRRQRRARCRASGRRARRDRQP